MTNLSIVLPELPESNRCLEEMRDAIAYAARDLGHDVECVGMPSQSRTNIILLPHQFVDAHASIPPGSILYNLEQVRSGSPFFQLRHMHVYRLFTVWDYDESNVASLKKMGVNAFHCPVGGHPLLRMMPDCDEDIDVVFAGEMNRRREIIIDEIRELGFHVEVLQGVYGPERDAYYARAKACLNVHYYEEKIFEAVRVSYLLQNRRCVLTEESLGGGDKPFRPGMWIAPYEDLPRRCAELLHDSTLREQKKVAALHVMRELRMEDSLRRLLP